MAQVARAAVDAGNFAINEGAQFAKTGAQGALIILPALETPAGDAFFAASAFVARVGSYAMGAGLALKLFGGAVLYAEGDPQPLQSAAVQLAQSHLEDNLGMPPLPFTDPLDAVAEAAGGKDSCP